MESSKNLKTALDNLIDAKGEHYTVEVMSHLRHRCRTDDYHLRATAQVEYAKSVLYERMESALRSEVPRPTVAQRVDLVGVLDLIAGSAALAAKNILSAERYGQYWNDEIDDDDILDAGAAASAAELEALNRILVALVD